MTKGFDPTNGEPLPTRADVDFAIRDLLRATVKSAAGPLKPTIEDTELDDLLFKTIGWVRLEDGTIVDDYKDDATDDFNELRAALVAREQRIRLEAKIEELIWLKRATSHIPEGHDVRDIVRPRIEQLEQRLKGVENEQ